MGKDFILKIFKFIFDTKTSPLFFMCLESQLCEPLFDQKQRKALPYALAEKFNLYLLTVQILTKASPGK